jgi:hypothetical protein
MPVPSAGFPGATTGSTPPLTPIGSSPNNLQATGFIPEIWSTKLIEKFYQSTVLAAISNTDYEGEIQNHGDRVKIRTKPTITIRPYAADGLLGLDRPTGGWVELYIGTGWYFSLILDDVMEVQSDLNILSMWSDDAAQQLKIKVDYDVLDGIVGLASSYNRGPAAGILSNNINLGIRNTPVSVVGRNPGAGDVELLDLLMRMGQCLDEQNVPEEGRWAVLPSWAGRMIKQSELRQAYLSGDSVSMLRNGRLGMIDRFTIYVSNLLPNGNSGSGGSGGNLPSPPVYDPTNFSTGEWPIFAGHAHGLTFASQISKVETLRSELTFGQILRGLQVYGYQVVDPKAIVEARVTPNS